jgi:hypothetical protein
MRLLRLGFELKLSQDASKASRAVKFDLLPLNSGDNGVRLTHLPIVENLLYVKLIENGDHRERHCFDCRYEDNERRA